MRPNEVKYKNQYILYDEDLLREVDTDLFDPAVLNKRHLLTGQARGRGTTHFFTYNGEEYVLRHYRRGGLIANLLQDRYLWTGLSRTRAWREWHLLAKMVTLGLPAPHPVAAQVHRLGRFYTADIIMHRLTNTQTLTEHLTRKPLPDITWRSIGKCIRRFHDAGIYHADLNANNILLGEENHVYLTDFDRGRIRHQSRIWQKNNLKRLHRSLTKLHSLHQLFHFSEREWQTLCAAYYSYT